MYKFEDFNLKTKEENVIIFNSCMESDKDDFVRHFACKFDSNSVCVSNFQNLAFVPFKNHDVVCIQRMTNIVDLVSLLALTRIYSDKIFVIDFYRNEDLPEIDGVTVYNLKADIIKESLT